MLAITEQKKKFIWMEIILMKLLNYMKKKISWVVMKQCTAHSIQKVHHGVQRQTQELLTITHYRLVSFELTLHIMEGVDSTSPPTPLFLDS